jgi:hypothetical protein
MNDSQYENMHVLVNRLLRNTGGWVTFDFDRMHQVAQDMCLSGTAEKRWDEKTGRIEYRLLCKEKP